MVEKKQEILKKIQEDNKNNYEDLMLEKIHHHFEAK